MTNSPAGGAIVQYAQGQEFYVPGTKFALFLNQQNILYGLTLAD